LRILFFTTIAYLAFVPGIWSQNSSHDKQKQPAKVSKTDSKPAAQFPAACQFANTKLTFKIILVANHTFCYDLLADGKIHIYQPSKPGLTDNEGFTTKDVAEK
jgi:hypothetical protein